MPVLSADEVERLLIEHNGNMASVARHFGVTRQAVCAYVHKRAKLLAVQADCRESMKDNAESALYKAVLAGEAWAVCFFLKCQAKDRGYVERQEVTGKDGEALPVLAIRIAGAEEAPAPGAGPAPPAAEYSPATIVNVPLQP